MGPFDNQGRNQILLRSHRKCYHSEARAYLENKILKKENRCIKLSGDPGYVSEEAIKDLWSFFNRFIWKRTPADRLLFSQDTLFERSRLRHASGSYQKKIAIGKNPRQKDKEDVMPISIKDRKEKARRLQQSILKDLKQEFSLSDSDVRPASMGAPGPNIRLSTFAKQYYPFSIGCKAHENINIYHCISEAIENAEKENLIPQLIFKRSNSDIFVVMRWDDWIKIYARGYEN